MQFHSILALCAAAALISAPLVHAAGEQAGAAPGSAQQALTEESSDAVMQVQKALNEAGYSAGPEDGVLGTQTHSAISEFQQAQGMEATGELDRDTINALGLDADSAEFAAFVEDEPGADTGMQENGAMQEEGGAMQDGSPADSGAGQGM